ncbi:MAG TPA: HD domain-containing protein [Gemmatimonadales bacterium]|jgi:HD superfamily phosphohydrolase YqeK|nr:HD domain-containing protein [Gemmatimonadales bacterium]
MVPPAPPPGVPSELRPTLPEWAQVSPDRLHHIQRVAELVVQWSERMGVPDSERNRWLKAVWLHDALRDAPAAELEAFAPSISGPAVLRHGPASAARAKAEGETDRGVLDAVRYHSVGIPEWDMVGRVLYCADFLEPGRGEVDPERAELAQRFPAHSQEVLYAVARLRMLHLIESGRQIPQPTLRFWNSLVAAPSSR